MPFRLTRAVKFLAIAQFAAFIIQQTLDRFFGTDLLGLFALVPSGFVMEHRLWQAVTYSFLHADLTHLIFNLLVLVFVGSELETFWGMKKFLLYYFFSVVFAGTVYVFFVLWRGAESGALHLPLVGASGGLYAVLLAYGLYFKNRTLLFMMIFPMQARVFAGILALMAFLSALYSPAGGGLSAVSHLAGMAGGGVYLLLFNRRNGRGGPTKRLKSRKTGPKLHVIRGGSQESEKTPTWH